MLHWLRRRTGPIAAALERPAGTARPHLGGHAAVGSRGLRQRVPGHGPAGAAGQGDFVGGTHALKLATGPDSAHHPVG